MPSKPKIGRNTLAPTPAVRLILKGENSLNVFHVLPPSANARTKIVAV
jgi:hypothetical protein